MFNISNNVIYNIKITISVVQEDMIKIIIVITIEHEVKCRCWGKIITRKKIRNLLVNRWNWELSIFLNKTSTYRDCVKTGSTYPHCIPEYVYDSQSRLHTQRLHRSRLNSIWNRVDPPKLARWRTHLGNHNSVANCD